MYGCTMNSITHITNNDWYLEMYDNNNKWLHIELF